MESGHNVTNASCCVLTQPPSKSNNNTINGCGKHHVGQSCKASSWSFVLEEKCSGLTTNLGKYSNGKATIGKILSTKVILSRLPQATPAQ